MGRKGSRQPEAAHGIVPARLAFAVLMAAIENAGTQKGRRETRLALNRYAHLTQKHKKNR